MSMDDVGRRVTGQKDTGGRVVVGPLAVCLANSLRTTNKSVSCITGVCHLVAECEPTSDLQGNKQRDRSFNIFIVTHFNQFEIRKKRIFYRMNRIKLIVKASQSFVESFLEINI